ncbi:hypothetical protein HF521_010024 [Silurus meridionalis]|uniref:Ig-like domain-containing protein n=1 Tax=Silurus meridionalis TaxID=175797 RepID=A0A8T0ANS0_SILME|nr:hypothetical protein HF521_010024 [Silurus meridionalis]
MKDLQTGNTGTYWCAVEIEGIFGPDVTEQLSITVKADPDLSVRESRVSGDEGGSVTVQCLYSAAYQNTQKKWCRFRDRSCNSVTRTDTSQNSAVNISDDGKSSFSVQMSGLKKSDGGWYWCSAGDLEVPVYISVRDPPPVITTTHHLTVYIEKVETLIHWYLAAFLLLLVILVIISCLLRKKCKAENQIKTREGSSDTTIRTSSAVKDNEDVTYSSVKMTSQDKTGSPIVVEGETIYSSVVCQ